ncbi:MAG: prolyl oligopeptidase family serine peptidase [Bacteroidetes bacterium]|nr:prolyl oligopeptidase family serine peptidase [Bacteroidota bacterium]
MKYIYSLLLLFAAGIAAAQTPKLTVGYIMRDPKWMGSSPSNPFWGIDNKLYFNWNPEKAISDSLYYINAAGKPQKVSPTERQGLVNYADIEFNKSRTAYVYILNDDVWYRDTKKTAAIRVTETTDRESQPGFAFNDTRLVFVRQQNLYAWDIATGATIQLTNIQRGTAPAVAKKDNDQEKWLKEDQLALFDILSERKRKKEATDSMNKKQEPKSLRTIYTDDKNVNGFGISNDGRFISYRLFKVPANAKSTIVPAYVTESGFTENIPARTKVGAPMGVQELFLFDRRKDTVYSIKTDSIPGIRDLPDYVSDYPVKFAADIKKPPVRQVSFSGISWAPTGTYAVVDICAVDNKDRWLMLLDSTGKLALIDRQHDNAWIGGPGTGWFDGNNSGWINDRQFWYQSEKTGYSHVYTTDVINHETKALTSGNFEIQSVQVSGDKKYFYLTSNKTHPGEKHFYRLSVTGGIMEQLSSMTGANQAVLSPDEKKIAILYSYSNKPWELYLQDNKVAAKASQLTDKAISPDFAAYPWREPELINFTARDGANVYARLYRPANAHASHPAVIFVHGAGYLQNAHKWWSSYFREYMFHNLLADAGYTVLDIDYRASAGYGRDWRTGIYRFMGGKDLTDNIDGAKLLVDKYGVDPKHIGVYGGSYGGFITLMALFTSPGTFAAGAALRPVTDWAHYNHGYTANILNEPVNDSIAYRRSSPIYHAAGLKDRLLICHGMVDVNVHFEDVVRLQQRLIELKKDNWELAAYPMEDHGFVEPSSWTDEYKRIFKLFEETLK